MNDTQEPTQGEEYDVPDITELGYTTLASRERKASLLDRRIRKEMRDAVIEAAHGGETEARVVFEIDDGDPLAAKVFNKVFDDYSKPGYRLSVVSSTGEKRVYIYWPCAELPEAENG